MINSEKELLSDIAQYLANERKIYGPFTFSRPTTTKNPGKTPSESTKESQPLNSGLTQEIEPSTSNIEIKPQNIREEIAACNTLDELSLLCKKADDLLTDLEETNLVFGVGNPNADLMLIGEAPGQEEDRQGEPFVGAAGQLLNKILKAINFNREDIYIANILKHRPPGNRNPSPEERLRSLPYLLRQIEIIQPKIILCLGKVSGTTLLEREDSLKNLRGKFYPFHGAELTVTYHPAALLRNPQWKRSVWEDVQKVRMRYDELQCKP